MPFLLWATATPDNCLQVINPDLAREWHPTKNKISASDVTPFANRTVWWLCQFGHEWEANISNRSNGNRCPFCQRQTSFAEIRIFAELKAIFDRVIHQAKLNNVECDILLPDWNIGLEIDGYYWHKNKQKIDKEKETLFKSLGITTIRVREIGLEPIGEETITMDNHKIDIDLIKKILCKISALSQVGSTARLRIDNYLKEQKFINEKDYKRLMLLLPAPLPEARPRSIKSGDWCPDCAGNRKVTIKEMRALTEAKGGKCLSDVYIDRNAKLTWQCAESHVFQVTPRRVKEGHWCIKCQ